MEAVLLRTPRGTATPIRGPFDVQLEGLSRGDTGACYWFNCGCSIQVGEQAQLVCTMEHGIWIADVDSWDVRGAHLATKCVEEDCAIPPSVLRNRSSRNCLMVRYSSR